MAGCLLQLKCIAGAERVAGWLRILRLVFQSRSNPKRPTTGGVRNDDRHVLAPRLVNELFRQVDDRVGSSPFDLKALESRLVEVAAKVVLTREDKMVRQVEFRRNIST